MVMDQEAKMVLQMIERHVGGIGKERMTFYFKLKEFHMTFGKIVS